MVNKISELGIKIGTIVLAVVTVVIILTALLGLFGIGFGYLLSNQVFDWATTNLGLDYHVANFLTAAAVFLIWTLGPSLMWKFWLQKRRMWSGLAGVAFYGVIWLMVSTVGGNVCFDRQTGKPSCYFADTTAGRKWSRTPGFDPESGKKFQLYTKEIKEVEEKRETVVPNSVSHNQNNTAPVNPRKITVNNDGLLNLSIETLELSVRTYNCLKKSNIKTVKNLINRSEKDLLEINYFSSKSLNEVKEVLKEMDLYLQK